MRHAVVAALALALAVGCGNDFDSPSIILGPRLLGVVAEPPETAPGLAVTLTPLTASLDGAPLTVRATADLSVRALSRSAGQTLGEPGEAVQLPVVDGVVTLSGEVTDAAIDALLAVVADAPVGTPEAVVRQVYEQVGLVVFVRVELFDASGEFVVEGFKRVVLTSRDDPTHNPPAPRFSLDGAVYSGSPRCRSGEAAPPSVAPGALLRFEPAEEDWLETYPAFDIEGRVVRGVESGYYSWFATAGAFDFAVTDAPDREVEWTAPETPGEVRFWLLVRDGHLGTSGCEFTLEVR